MFDYFCHLLPEGTSLPRHILLEDQSVNTIENIQNAADKLVASQLCNPNQVVSVCFVSNDYHLKRIFEIQQLLDEQGLLRTLTERCLNSCLELSIPMSISDHIVALYPHRNVLGQAFLLIDELTTYRVYLEGVKSGVFERELHKVRAVPLKIAQEAIAALKGLGLNSYYLEAIDQIERAVQNTTPSASLSELIDDLNVLNVSLTWLNRNLDPERQSV